MRFLLTLILSSGLLAACSQLPARKSYEAPLELRASINFHESDPRTRAFIFFAEQVREKTNGNIIISVFHGMGLTSIRQGLEACGSGITQLAYIVPDYSPGALPKVQVLAIPYANKLDDWQRILEILRPLLESDFTRNNVKLLFATRPAHSLLCTRKKFVKTLEDFRGMKVRVAGGVLGEAVKAWGATPVSLSGSEQYMAFQTNVIDAANITYSSYYRENTYEVAPYVTAYHAVMSNFLYVMNLDVWNSLPAAEQDMVMQCAAEAQSLCERLELEEELSLVEKFKAVGVKIYEMPSEEIARWKNASAPLYRDYINRVGREGQQIVDLLRSN